MYGGGGGVNALLLDGIHFLRISDSMGITVVFLSLVEIALPEAFSSQFPYTPCAHVIIRPNHRLCCHFKRASSLFHESMLFRGDLVHCPALGQLDILHDHLLG